MTLERLDKSSLVHPRTDCRASFATELTIAVSQCFLCRSSFASLPLQGSFTFTDARGTYERREFPSGNTVRRDRVARGVGREPGMGNYSHRPATRQHSYHTRGVYLPHRLCT